MCNILNKSIRKMQRFVNQAYVNDYCEEAAGWHKYNGNPVLGDSFTGTLFDPFVRRVGNEFIMCVSRRASGSLALYHSIDGIRWKSSGEILCGIPESGWEAKVNRGCFLVKDGEWYLWYTGQSNTDSKIGFAKSADGITFDRILHEPILVPQYAHEGKAVMNPCVLWEAKENLFRMWYAAGESYEPNVICYAESSDGIEWNKREKPIIMADRRKKYRRYKVGACDVLKTKENEYYMAYICYQNLDVARVALAFSSDGINGWKDVYEFPVLGPGKGRWDGHAVYKPTLCEDSIGGKTLLWYNGRLNTTEKIGLAILDELL